MSESEAKVDDPEPHGPKDANMYGFWTGVPRLTPMDVRNLTRQLRVPYDDAACDRAIRGLEETRRMAPLLQVGYVLLPVSYVLLLAVYVIRTVVADKWSSVASTSWLLGLVGFFLILTLLYRGSIPNARNRFFRNIAKAIHKLPTNEYDHLAGSFALVLVINRLGTAARALFLDLQGSRRTWRPPPLLTDRATTLATSLIDFNISDGIHRQDMATLATLRRLLHDFAVVVAIDREDLLQEVRELHEPHLPRRQGEEERGRDAAYLNAMRDRNRWDVVKDFLYPLAPWFSVLVASAALVVSIVRP